MPDSARSPALARLHASLARGGLGLLLAWALLCALGMFHVSRETPFASSDDFPRLALSMIWSHAPFFAPWDAFWLPLPTWLYGIAYTLWGRPTEALYWFIPLSAGLLAVTAWLTGRATPLNNTWLPLALLLGTPLTARLPTSGISEIPAMALGALFLWALARRAAQVTRAPLLIGLTTLIALQACRYELWPLTFLGALLLAAPRLTPPPRRTVTLVCLALSAFPLLWMAVNAHLTGDPFNFLVHARTQVNPTPTLYDAPHWQRVIYVVRTALLHTGWLLLWALLGLRPAWRRVATRPLLLWAALPWAVYLFSGIPASRHTTTFERTLLFPAVATLPLALIGFRHLRDRFPAHRRALLALFLLGAAANFSVARFQAGHTPILAPTDLATAERLGRTVRRTDGRIRLRDPQELAGAIQLLRVFAGPSRIDYAPASAPLTTDGACYFFTDPPWPDPAPPDGFLLNYPYSVLHEPRPFE